MLSSKEKELFNILVFNLHSIPKFWNNLTYGTSNVSVLEDKFTEIF